LLERNINSNYVSLTNTGLNNTCLYRFII